MKGYGQPIGNRPNPYIKIDRGQYVIDWYDYEMTATSTELANFTQDILKIFSKLEKASRKSIKLDPSICQERLDELATRGMRAYRKFFEDSHARQVLATRFRDSKERPTPTFISKEFLFPWEVLYDGKVKPAHADGFWGIRYAPARILQMRRHDLVGELPLPMDMIFGLHDQLKAAHRLEQATLERLFRRRNDRFRVLGPGLKPIEVCDGESLLRYLTQANHNMIHFACHCLEKDGVDSLLISLIDETKPDEKAASIELNANHFLDVETSFQRQPFVFLNACKSGGGTTALQQTFNLPSYFVKRKAAAVIATACPVPDLFAAEFAKHFYELFLGGQEIEDQQTGETRRIPIPIGEALRQTRHHFLSEHHNPLGLAYGLYSPAHYRLAQEPARDGW